MPRSVLRASVVVAAVLLSVLPSFFQALAQGSFRVTYNVDRTGPSHIELSGTVFNDAPADAIDVYVTAQALDREGRRVARGIAWVGTVNSNSSTGFTAKIPAVPGAATYRVGVTSYRYVTVSQGP